MNRGGQEDKLCSACFLLAFIHEHLWLVHTDRDEQCFNQDRDFCVFDCIVAGETL